MRIRSVTTSIGKSSLIVILVNVSRALLTYALPSSLGSLFVLDDASTLFTWTAGVWDLEIEFSGGDVRRLAQGSISVSPEVTRD